jgi:hypothetical protein
MLQIQEEKLPVICFFLYVYVSFSQIRVQTRKSSSQAVSGGYFTIDYLVATDKSKHT